MELGGPEPFGVESVQSHVENCGSTSTEGLRVLELGCTEKVDPSTVPICSRDQAPEAHNSWGAHGCPISARWEDNAGNTLNCYTMAGDGQDKGDGMGAKPGSLQGEYVFVLVRISGDGRIPRWTR